MALSPTMRSWPRVKISWLTVTVSPFAPTALAVFVLARQPRGGWRVTKKWDATERAVAHDPPEMVRLFSALWPCELVPGTVYETLPQCPEPLEAATEADPTRRQANKATRDKHTR